MNKSGARRTKKGFLGSNRVHNYIIGKLCSLKVIVCFFSVKHMFWGCFDRYDLFNECFMRRRKGDEGVFLFWPTGAYKWVQVNKGAIFVIVHSQVKTAIQSRTLFFQSIWSIFVRDPKIFFFLSFFLSFFCCVGVIISIQSNFSLSYPYDYINTFSILNYYYHIIMCWCFF